MKRRPTAMEIAFAEINIRPSAPMDNNERLEHELQRNARVKPQPTIVYKKRKQLVR